MEHAHTGAVEGVFRGVPVCVRHQLPPSLGHAEENVHSAGRPVLTHRDAHR